MFFFVQVFGRHIGSPKKDANIAAGIPLVGWCAVISRLLPQRSYRQKHCQAII